MDAGRYREVMGHYPTGVAVVTGTSPEGEPIGMVVGTFTAVSMDPPLVAFMPTTNSGTYAMMRDSSAYCINVLAHDQRDLCSHMAVPRPGKFDDIEWSRSPLGAPALSDVVARIHVTPDREVDAGDHYIVLCAVTDMEVVRPVTPLLFFQGGYGGFNPGGLTARGDADLIAAIRVAEIARPQIERLAKTFACESAVLVAANDQELTTAASAYGGEAEVREPLGERIPLMPPLGEAYVAWLGDEQIAAWLRRASSQAPEVIAKYERRLADVRERGYAISRTNPDNAQQYADLRTAMQEYAAGELTPIRERAVRSVIAETSAFFETCDIVEDDVYHLGSVVVPVLGPDGRTAMCLRLTQVPQGVTGRQVLEWVAALEFAAGSVARELASRGRDEFDAYQSLVSGDFMM